MSDRQRPTDHTPPQEDGTLESADQDFVPAPSRGARFVDGVLVFLLVLSTFLVFCFCVFIIGAVLRATDSAHRQNMYLARNAVDRTITEVTPASKTPSKITHETDVSNLTNVKELFPLASAFVLFVAFTATLYQMRSTAVQQGRAEALSRKQFLLAQRQFREVHENASAQARQAREEFDLARQQSERAEAWRKTEFIAKQLEAFSRHRSVVNVKRMVESIDAPYNPRLVLDLVDGQHPDSERSGPTVTCEVQITKQQMLNGFTPDHLPFRDVRTGEEIPGKAKHTPLENKIAYEVDAFMDYLTVFRKLIEDGMLEMRELRPYIDYWLRLILEPEDESDNPEVLRQAGALRAALQQYLMIYYYGPEGSEDSSGRECRFITLLVGVPFEGSSLYRDGAAPARQAEEVVR